MNDVVIDFLNRIMELWNKGLSELYMKSNDSLFEMLIKIREKELMESK